MKRTPPELFVVLVLALDVAFRFMANLSFEPGSITNPDHVAFLGNVHHPSGIRAFGLSTVQWMLISLAVALVFWSAMFGLTKAGFGKDSTWMSVLRFALFVPVVLAPINIVESLLFSRVTDYVGIIHSESRFIAVNLGDLVLWASLLVTPVAASVIAVSTLVGLAKQRTPHHS